MTFDSDEDRFVYHHKQYHMISSHYHIIIIWTLVNDNDDTVVTINRDCYNINARHGVMDSDDEQ